MWKKKPQVLTTVDGNPVGTVLLRQFSSVGSDLDLKESDVAVLVVLHVLLGVEGAEVSALGVAALENAQAVDAVLLHLFDAHTGDAVVGFVKSSDDVAESGALGIHAGGLGLVGRLLGDRRVHLRLGGSLLKLGDRHLRSRRGQL
jgi:hypothetical protein